MEPSIPSSKNGTSSAQSGPSCFPARMVCSFGMRREGQGAGRLRDHGDVVAPRHPARRSLRGPLRAMRGADICSLSPSDGKLLGHSVRSQEAGDHRAADRALRRARIESVQLRGLTVSPQPARSSITTASQILESRRRVGDARGHDDAYRSGWNPEGTVNSISHSLRTARRLAIRIDSQQQAPGHLGQAAPIGPFSRLTFGDTAFLRPTWSEDGDPAALPRRSGRWWRHRVHETRRRSRSREAVLRTKLGLAQVSSHPDGKWMILRGPRGRDRQWRHLGRAQGTAPSCRWSRPGARGLSCRLAGWEVARVFV